MIALATAGSLQADACIVAVGLAVGWAATASGLGAGLALPILAAFGLPLPAALLAVKLPVSLSDLAAALGERRQAALGVRAPMRASRGAGHHGSPAGLALATLAGALGAAALFSLPAATLAIGAPLLAALALWLRHALHTPAATPAMPRPALQPVLTATWGVYVGGCGIGAGLLWRLGGFGRPGRPALDGAGLAGFMGHADSGLALRAAANIGALLVLLGAGQRITAALCLLAAAQGLGAWLATRQAGVMQRLCKRFHTALR